MVLVQSVVLLPAQPRQAAMGLKRGATGYRLTPEGVEETRRWFRKVRRRLRRDADDLRTALARFGDLLETLPKQKRRGN